MENPEFKFGDNVRTCKHKNIFSNICTENWLEKSFYD